MSDLDTVVTADLSRFGYRELRMAAETLTAMLDQGKPEQLGEGLTLNMNISSGYVFLSDEDYNVAMMNGDKLETWFNCSYCGWEGFAEDLDDEHHMSEWGTVEHGPAPADDEE